MKTLGRGAHLARLALAAALVVPTTPWAVVAPTSAQGDCAAATEPDDVPETATHVSDAFCSAGELTGGDQDLLIWDVTEGSSEAAWRITLQGVGGTLTSLRILPVTSEPGFEPVAVGSQILQLDSPPTATTPVVGPDVLLSPGRYLVGISRTDRPDGARPWSFDYRFDIAPVDPPEPAGRAADGAFAVASEAALLEPAVLDWNVPESSPDQAWAIEALTPLGVSLTLTLEGEDGTRLVTAYSDSLGHVLVPDLDLTPGGYRLRADASSEAPVPIRLAASRAARIGDREPNDQPAIAVPLDGDRAVARGRIWPPPDQDHYRLEVPADGGDSLVDVRLISDEGRNRTLCLYHDDVQLQCRVAATIVTLPSLLLAPGTYVMTVSGEPDVPPADDAPATDALVGYVLRVDRSTPPAPDFETEPNDSPALASPFDPTLVMRGRGDVGDVDLFRVTVSGEPQLWEAEAVGPALGRLAWMRGDGTVLAEARPAGAGDVVRISDLYLVPGEHLFAVDSTGGYEVRMTPLGPPDPDAEREPNDSVVFAEPISLSRSRILGRLATPSDRDVFRFSLAGRERIVLEVTPPADSAIDLGVETKRMTVTQARSSGAGVASRLDLLLDAGDYEVVLANGGGSAGSSERYELRLERGDPLAARDDVEPNDILDHASPVGPTLVVKGTGGPLGDVDWYALPPLEPGTGVRVSVTGAVSDVDLSDGSTDLGLSFDPASGTLAAEAGLGLSPRYVRILANGDYTAVIDVDGLTAARPPLPSPVRMTVTPSVDVVAAYWPTGQRVDGEVALSNAGFRPLDLVLDAVTSHHGWTASLPSAAVSLAPGATMTVPLSLVAPPDAWADEPVLVTVRARTADGAQGTAQATITPRRDGQPVAPEVVWPLPDGLLGGLDVASLALGATTIPSIDPVAEDALHDGYSLAAAGFRMSVASLPVTLTVDLAGDGPVPVAGTILDPVAWDGVPGDVPDAFELLLSTDGVTFTPVLSGRLSTFMGEQAFELEEPVDATHAQLRLLDVHGGGLGQVSLGEWKVVAVPGVVPGGLAEASTIAGATGGLDLGRVASGGHVAWIDPQGQDPYVAVRMADDDPAVEQLVVPSGSSLTWAVGFRSGRAALVERLEWVDPIGSDPGLRAEEVDVAISLDGPAGPWRDAGRWTLERLPDGSVTSFELPAETWARAIRLSAVPPPERRDTGLRELPARIRVIERAIGPDYRSILGEWGADSSWGPYEHLASPELVPPASGPDEDDTLATAGPLRPGDPVAGQVSADVDVDWYTIEVPAEHNSLTVAVAGRPIASVALTLFDADGLRVPMIFGPGERPGTIDYRAEVEPGAAYSLEVRQPPSSIVFTYDTSASIGPYLEDIYHGLRAFTADVTPGKESVLVLPFEEEPLLDQWSDDRYELQNAVDRRLGAGGSSGAEKSLLDATTRLSAREGARAILVATDAETTTYPSSTQLWQAFAAVRPLVFAIHVGGAGEPYLSTSYMQHWAVAGRGVYRYASTLGEMDRAFDRLATWLRRPAGYELRLATSFEEKPPPSREPGSVEVRSPADGGPAAIATDVSVELILDTSGSMLERIRRRPRIDIARHALRDLVTERLPAGIPVALRIFGDAGDECGTRLAVPLGPLDPAGLVTLVDGLEIDKRTSTPIAAALARVPDDLAGTTGTRIVVLVTDGDETCGGDVAGAIEDLERRGIDARVNIVGFSVRDRRVRRDMQRWARLGGGSYFDARGGDDLGRAIARAVRPPIRVLDEAGNEVGSGTLDGKPVEVPPGTYSIVVLSDPVVRFDGVAVGPEEAVVREMPSASG